MKWRLVICMLFLPFAALNAAERVEVRLVDGGRTLAVYEGTTIPAATVVRRDGWQAFLFASAPLPAAVLRYVVTETGCHRYTTNDDVIYTGRNHEDSNWKPGSKVSHLLPVYRDAFQRIWNRDKQGHSKFSQSIGSAESRPIGTPWEDTSFAYKYKNALFVTIDVFDQPDPDKPVGYLKRSIHANMPLDHLRWFEEVLKEARKDPRIHHIIVQAHSPVLTPVRGQYITISTLTHCWQMVFGDVQSE